MNNLSLDSHKLIYHPERVSQFLQTGDCFPLYVEISPTGSCNHRCIFCAYDFIGYPNRKLETNRTLKLLDELAVAGVKSILFAGEGEPLLHQDITTFINHAKKNKIDVGLFTNGQLLSYEKSASILHALTFIRFSFNAGTCEVYSRIHGVRPETFTQVITAIATAAAIKQKQELQTAIGAQFVVLAENIDSLPAAAKILKAAGADYLAVKPFVQQSDSQGYCLTEPLDASQYNDRLAAAKELSDANFTVIARNNAFDNITKPRYCHCYGTSFISAINSAGDISSCLPYWDNPDFVFGNIYQQTFSEIWHSEQRMKIKVLLESGLDISQCPDNCRPNAINEFLYELKHPTIGHINFI